MPPHSSPSSSSQTAAASGYDLTRSLTAIAFAILATNGQVFLVHLNGSVIPPSSTNLTANTTTAISNTTGKTLQDVFSIYHFPIFVTLITLNVFGFNLLVSHSLRSPNEVVYNIATIAGVGYAAYHMAKVYSWMLSLSIGGLSLFSMAFVILSLSDRFCGIYQCNRQRITNLLRRCIKALFQDQLIPVSTSPQEHTHAT
ncbi:hypothetical protein QL285_054174 [Trifolium repens]|jgi:hypothetical protein|nr:hypothetical protein QL285_054157 [Trifolium repens]KAK2404869.1 hypothetical protein QL285_054174 [Trifolium repens]